MIKSRSFFRFFYFLLSLLLFVLFILGWVYIDKTSKDFLFFLISISLNYLITVIVSIKLLNSQKKSSLLISFYLFVFLSFPFIGLLAYFLFVTREIDVVTIKNYKKRIKKYQKYENYAETEQFLRLPCNTLERLFEYNYVKHNQPVYSKNKITLIKNPFEHINAIVELIKKAKKFIHLEYYIFCDGHVLNYLLILLEEKIKDGVEVKLIIDDWGNYWKLKKSTKKKIESIGIQMKLFNPMFQNSNFWWQFRNHNKLIVVDNEYALHGSCNISDEYFNITNYYFQTTEISVLLEGEIVNSLNVLFFAHWHMHEDDKKHKGSNILLQSADYLISNKKENENSIMQLINSSPLMEDQIIKSNLNHMIYHAKKSIIISTPYFYPPKDIIESLKFASVLGVNIKILVPRQADFSNFYRRIHRQIFFELLDSNIEIYEYFGFNHEKITIVDDELVFMGTYNWDYRALYLNFESSMLIKSKDFVNELQKIMQKQMKNSYKITKNDLQISKKILSNILIDSTIQLFKPFL